MDRDTVETQLQQHRDHLATQRARVADMRAALERGEHALAQLEGAVLALEQVLAAPGANGTGGNP